MADRTVRVRLEADISDFVGDIGVKAVAAVKRLEGAASKADVTLKKTATDGNELGTKVGAAASTAGKELDKLAVSVGKVDKATTSNAKSTQVAIKATDAHASAIGRLRVAQLRLAEIQKQSNPKASVLAGAEEAVAAAERNVKKFEKTGSDSGRSFGSGFKKWVSGSGGGLFSELGKSGGSVFGSGFLGALKTPILGPAIVAILTAAFVTIMPAIGAVAGGALVTGFGAGLAGLGLVFAAQSARVGGAWSKTMSRLGEDMKLLSAPFEFTLINIAGFFERTVNAFNPALSAAFQKMAGPVQTFADQLLRGFEQLVPAIGPITTAFNAVLASLGPAMQSLIGDLAAGMTELANSVAKNPQALADLVTGLGSIVKTTLDFITTLNDINAGFSTLTGGVSLVTVVMKGLEGIVGAVAGPFAALGKAIDLVNAATGRTGKDVAGAGKSMSDAANDTVSLAQGLSAVGPAAQHALPPLHAITDALTRQKNQFTSTITAMGQWADKAIGSSNASIALEQAIDDSSASIKENGRTLDIHTAKGRANQSALNNLAASAKGQMVAMDEAGASNVAVAATGERAKASFIRLATQMGLTKAQAKVMADSMIKIPNVSREAKLTANKKDLETKLAAAKKELDNPKGVTKERKAQLNANITKLEAGIAAAKAALAGVPTSKTVTITSRFVTERITRNQTTTAQGGHAINADGGYYPHGMFPSFANGKLPKQAMVAPGKGRGLVQWAEGETGGEAFIPLAPSKRARSTEILGQVADTFGLGLVKSFASGGFLPGGNLVDVASLIRALNATFNPLAGINYGGTLQAQNRANAAVNPAKAAATRADRTEKAARTSVEQINRQITLQRRLLTQLRNQPKSKARDARIAQEERDLIVLQDRLTAAKKRQKAATDASSKADANYKAKVDAAKTATDAHKASIEALVQQQKAAADLAKQIADGLTSGANIGDLFGQTGTGQGLLADLQAKGAELGKFKGQVDRLRKAGLSEELISQIIGKGAEQGGEVAQGILDGGQALVNALNKAQNALDAQANLIGAGSATKQFGVKVAGARAGGGDVEAGKTYRVNERGQEFFTAPINGHVIPAGQDPRRYIRTHGGTFGGTAPAVVEKHVILQQEFHGTDYRTADAIGHRTLAAARFAGRA